MERIGRSGEPGGVRGQRGAVGIIGHRPLDGHRQGIGTGDECVRQPLRLVDARRGRAVTIEALRRRIQVESLMELVVGRVDALRRLEHGRRGETRLREGPADVMPRAVNPGESLADQVRVGTIVDRVVKLLDGLGQFLGFLGQMLARRGQAHVRGEVFRQATDLVGHLVRQVVDVRLAHDLALSHAGEAAAREQADSQSQAGEEALDLHRQVPRRLSHCVIKHLQPLPRFGEVRTGMPDDDSLLACETRTDETTP